MERSQTTGDDRVPVLSDAADALERLVFARRYRQFLRVLAVVLVALLLVHGVRFLTGDPALSAGATAVLDAVTAAAVTLFVLAGVVQLVVFARGVERREVVVAETAEEVERSAQDVERSAKDVERAAEELEDAVDEPAPEKAPEIEDRVRQAEEQASEARKAAGEVKKELGPEGEGDGNEEA